LQSYVKALISGLQGDEDTLKVAATCKHFTAYDVEDWHGNDRYGFNAEVSTQDLNEYYMPPFKTCARDAGVA
jgi:xylan 1,4-beta-xylosidase